MIAGAAPYVYIHVRAGAAVLSVAQSAPPDRRRVVFRHDRDSFGWCVELGWCHWQAGGETMYHNGGHNDGHPFWELEAKRQIEPAGQQSQRRARRTPRTATSC